MAQVKKLSVATVYGKIDVKKLLAAAGEQIHCMRVLGQAVSIKDGTSSYGDWRALLGQFECTNPDTGEVFQGATLFLPEVAMIPITVALAQEGARGCEFAIDIFVKYAHNAKPGGSVYEYTWAPLLPPAEGDPISRLKAKLLALEAPAPSDPPPPAPAVKSGKK